MGEEPDGGLNEMAVEPAREIEPRGEGIGRRHSRWRVYLSLGRVSNLPTVWTNVLAGMVLAGAPADWRVAALLAVAVSFAYVGGMFLNDAFDRDLDAVERPERPIASGQISAPAVFRLGFAMLGLCVAGVASAALGASVPLAAPLASALALCAVIVLYDAWHKNNPLSPVVMGACRALVYVTAGLAAGGRLDPPLVLGSLALLGYVVGLTFVARQENRKSFRGAVFLLLLATPLIVAVLAPNASAITGVAAVLFAGWVVAAVAPLFAKGPVDVPRSVVRMIAGIALLDGMLAAAYGAPGLMVVGVGGLLVTLGMQRFVRGT